MSTHSALINLLILALTIALSALPGRL